MRDGASQNGIIRSRKKKDEKVLCVLLWNEMRDTLNVKTQGIVQGVWGVPVYGKRGKIILCGQAADSVGGPRKEQNG